MVSCSQDKGCAIERLLRQVKAELDKQDRIKEKQDSSRLGAARKSIGDALKGGGMKALQFGGFGGAKPGDPRQFDTT